jgi:hypothetical protein
MLAGQIVGSNASESAFMVDVFLDKRLDDYFTAHEWSQVATDDSARDAVLSDFLGEKIAVLQGLETNTIDFEFLEKVRFPQTWGMKKFQFKDLLAEARAGKHHGIYAQVLSDSFSGDQERFDYFLGQLEIIENIAERLLGRLLDGLTVTTRIMVARFSETRMENLHYDIDQDSDDHEAFRLYVNLDANPRIWSTSYTMTRLFREGGERLLGNIDPNERSEIILKRAIGRAYGGWNQRATERRAPRHQVYFDPGDVWIVDGRSVSHQVLSGHRVLSIYVRIPHAENPELRPTFAEKARSAFAEGLKVPLGQETAEVNYFEPNRITGPANLREEWSDVFGQTRTGRIRRFDDTGLVVR